MLLTNDIQKFKFARWYGCIAESLYTNKQYYIRWFFVHFAILSNYWNCNNFNVSDTDISPVLNWSKWQLCIAH